MKKYNLFLFSIFLLAFFLSSCEDKEERDAVADIAEQRCGDGVCDAIEQDRGICVEDCPVSSSESTTSSDVDSGTSSPSTSYDMETYIYEPVELETAWTSSVSSTKISETEDSTRGIIISEYTVINPTSNADLAVIVY